MMKAAMCIAISVATIPPRPNRVPSQSTEEDFVGEPM
jgi:hypothetical protein